MCVEGSNNIVLYLNMLYCFCNDIYILEKILYNRNFFINFKNKSIFSCRLTFFISQRL